MATQYIVIHNKHEGCYDYHCYEDMETRMRITSITINPPKIFLFQTREQAQDFFEEYMNDIDCLDIRCKKENDEVEHIECCTCGIIECDKNGDPILFYNKKNQIFLLEQKQQFFMPDFQLKSDISNMNLTNRLIHKVRRLDKEQRKKFIELGKYCQDCDNDENNSSSSTSSSSTSNNTENVQIKMEQPSDNDSDNDNDNDSDNENMKIHTIEQVNNVINTLKENMNMDEVDYEKTKQDIFNIMIKKANEYVDDQNKEGVSAPSIEVSSSVENKKEKKKKSKTAKEPKADKEPKAAKSTKKESKTSKKKASSSKTDND